MVAVLQCLASQGAALGAQIVAAAALSQLLRYCLPGDQEVLLSPGCRCSTNHSTQGSLFEALSADSLIEKTCMWPYCRKT